MIFTLSSIFKWRFTINAFVVVHLGNAATLILHFLSYEFESLTRDRISPGERTYMEKLFQVGITQNEVENVKNYQNITVLEFSINPLSLGRQLCIFESFFPSSFNSQKFSSNISLFAQIKSVLGMEKYNKISILKLNVVASTHKKKENASHTWHDLSHTHFMNNDNNLIAHICRSLFPAKLHPM